MPGQTLSEVRALLAAAGLTPQHRFGQNFLVDLNLMRKLVTAAAPGPGDVVLEVGPGTGSLTELLLDSGATVVAAEIDRGLAALLRWHFADAPRFTLVEGDALAGKHAISPAILAALATAGPADAPRKLIANLPYQIATPLLMELLYLRPAFASLTCTIQKEVGQRLQAIPRNEHYGPLAVIAQTLATVRPLAALPPRAFWPAPQVESVMVQLIPLPTPPVSDAPAFVDLVRRAFLQRRKMLRRIIRGWPDADAAHAALAAAGLSPDRRPEELAVADWQRWHALRHSPLRSPECGC
jgi:16S rRNA (adenine1518-N6/adenine1519-N6)-dimethyltransferase